MFIFLRSINRLPDVLKKLASKQAMSIMKLLAFIFHDGNTAHFAQMSEGLLEKPYIVISVFAHCGS